MSCYNNFIKRKGDFMEKEDLKKKNFKTKGNSKKSY